MMRPFTNYDGDQGVGQVTENAVGIPGVQETVGEDDVGRRDDVFPPEEKIHPGRVRFDVVSVVTLLSKFGKVPGLGFEKVVDAIITFGID